MINIDILKPQCRIDDLWVRVITKNDVDLPLPHSRLELYVTALITGNIDNLPYPQSRVEMLLYCILTDTEYTFNAQSRVEMFLKAIITLDIEGLPTPMSRLEWYLDYIVRNGCLEKYEYYPFNIWSYLNVKNTPKARMKFKSMKGNTLVNLARAVNLTIDDKSPTTNNIPFNSVQGFQSGKKYTIVCKFEGYKGTKPIKFRQRKYDTSWNYEFNTLIKDFSDGIKIAVYTPTQDFKDVALYLDYVDEKDTSVSISDVIILEGDYTQNPPNGYIEGMQSFGDDANKIEVLSTGINYFNNNPDMWEQGTIDGVKGELLGSSNRIRTKDYIELPPKVDYMSFQVKEAGYKMAVRFYDNNKWMISGQDKPYQGFISGELRENMPKQAKYMKLVCAKESEGYIAPDDVEKSKLQLTCNNEIFDYVPYGSSKAIPMYRNSANELVPVLVLRGKWGGDRFLWGDEILEHEDKKLYYHKRCDKVIFNGNEPNWKLYTPKPEADINTICFEIDISNKYNQSNDKSLNIISDKFNTIPASDSYSYDIEGIADRLNLIRVKINRTKLDTKDIAGFKNLLKKLYDAGNPLSAVYQLAKEEVYLCELSEQLYSYDNETNIFINGGAVVGETVIEVGTKLGPIVAGLKQETKIVTDGLKGVLAGDMQELAYQLYPDDFNKDTVEIKLIESVE